MEIAGYDPDSDAGESYVGVEPTKMHQITICGIITQDTFIFYVI